LLALNAGTTLVRFEYLRSTAQIATASFYISAHATASHSVRVSMAESEEIFLSIFSFYFTDGCLFPVKKMHPFFDKLVEMHMPQAHV